MLKSTLCLAVALGFCATAAAADPCEAPLPNRGQTFSGLVSYVGDGDSLCVALGPDPASWVEVRLADFYAPELSTPEGRQAKAVLERLVRSRRAVCVAQHRSWDRIVAMCRVNGVSIGHLMRSAGVREGGRR